MRVLINAASAKMGGNVTYLQNVMRWLPRLAPDDEFVVYLPEVTRRAVEDDGGPNIFLRTYPFENTGGAARIFFDQVQVPAVVRELGIDVLFSETGFGTYLSPCPEVLLVRNPVYFSRAFRQKYRSLGRSLLENRIRRWLSVLSVRYADRVLFPTEAMQEMVGRYVELDQAKCSVLSYGYDPDYFQDGTAEPHFVSEVRRWKAQGYRVLLNVSTFAVHKNMETLVEALPHIRAQGARVKLVLTTSREATSDKREYDALQRRIRNLGVDDAFAEVGYVPPAHLGALYEQADVYVFPSFIESFGHTMVEAMGHALPVVAADTPVNREVCRDAASYFSTFDAEACAHRVVQLLDDETARSTARRAARERSADFSWQRYVEDLMDVFRSLVSSP